MAAIPVFGRNGEALTGSCTDARAVMETGAGTNPDFDGDGRVFELLHLAVWNNHAASAALLHLWDRDEGSQPTTTLQVGAPIPCPALALTVRTWERGTGPRFRTNIVASTSRALNQGTIRVRDVFVSGLLH